MFENEDRLRKLENRIHLLTWMVGAQLAITAVLGAVYLTSSLVASASKLMLFAIVAGVLAVIFRKQLPAIGRRIGRVAGWLMRSRNTPSVG